MIRFSTSLLSIVLCAAGSLWSASHLSAKTVEFSIASFDGSVGSTVKTPLIVEKGVGVGAIQLNVTFDPAVLEPVTVEPADGVNALVDFNVISPGTLRLALASTQGIENDGEVVLIEWKVLGGTSSQLELTDIRAWEQKTSFELPVTATAGEFKVTSTVADPAVASDRDDIALPVLMPITWLIGFAVIGIVIVLLLVMLLLRKP